MINNTDHAICREIVLVLVKHGLTIEEAIRTLEQTKIDLMGARLCETSNSIEASL